MYELCDCEFDVSSLQQLTGYTHGHTCLWLNQASDGGIPGTCVYIHIIYWRSYYGVLTFSIFGYT